MSDEEQELEDADEAFLRFLVEEGLDALSAYRAIKDPSIRAMFIRLMKEAARAKQQSNPDLN